MFQLPPLGRLRLPVSPLHVLGLRPAGKRGRPLLLLLFFLLASRGVALPLFWRLLRRRFFGRRLLNARRLLSALSIVAGAGCRHSVGSEKCQRPESRRQARAQGEIAEVRWCSPQP